MYFRDPGNPGTKVAFIKFQQGGSVGVAQHLTNTVFIDRPLVCVPFNEGNFNLAASIKIYSYYF